MDNIFELASRKKLRYPTDRGQVTTEDLWDLSLEALDKVAKTINKDVETGQEKSFIKKQSTGDKVAQLKLDVVVSVINTKLAEEERRKAAAERKQKRDRIIQLIAEKEDGALAKKSLTSLRGELDKLDEEEELEEVG